MSYVEGKPRFYLYNKMTGESITDLPNDMRINVYGKVERLIIKFTPNDTNYWWELSPDWIQVTIEWS